MQYRFATDSGVSTVSVAVVSNVKQASFCTQENWLLSAALKYQQSSSEW